MFMRLIYLKNSTFLSLKITVDTLIDVRNETSKHHFLKSVKINKLTLLPLRTFQSVSGHSSDQSIAHYHSRPTVLQLKGISDTIQTDLRITNHRGHKFPPSITLLSFKKLESNGLQVDRNRKFSERINSTPAIFQATSKLFGLQGCSDDKN